MKMTENTFPVHSIQINDILETNGNFYPGMPELLTFYGGIGLGDITHALRDRSIPEDTKHTLTKLIREVSFQEIEPFLFDDHIPETVKIELGRHIQKTPHRAIQAFLQNKKIPEKIKISIAEKIEPVSFEEAEAYILDQNTSQDIKKIILEHLQAIPFSQVEHLLTHTETPRYVRYAIAKNITEASFSQIEKILMNDSVDENIQFNLAEGIGEISLQEAESFLKDENREVELRQLIAEKIHKLPFRQMNPLLTDDTLSESLRIALASRIHETSLEEMKSFLRDESLSEYIRGEIAKHTPPLSFEETKDFFEDENTSHMIKESLIARLQRIPFSDKIKTFLENTEIDGEIRYGVAEKIQWSNTADAHDIFEKIQKTFCHAREINRYQLSQINENISERIPEKRTLILYFREGQGGFLPHAEIFAHFLESYIRGGYSSVWNDFKITSRFGEIHEIGGIPSEYQKGINFTSICGIYADTFHMSHGTPISHIPGTHSLVGRALFSDVKKISGMKKGTYTKFAGLYYAGTSRESIQHLTSDDGLGFPLISSEELLEMLLKTLREAERTILKNAGMTESGRTIEQVRELVRKI